MTNDDLSACKADDSACEPKMLTHLTKKSFQSCDIDYVSDIRNHISPTTVVIDLDAEEELERGNGDDE